MNIIKFNFRNFETREQRKLFVPINSLSFASFPVKIRFPQPPRATMSVMANARFFDGRSYMQKRIEVVN